jgi:hypothetical protein
MTALARKYLGWNRASYTLLSLFLVTVLVILYAWWPLAQDYLALFNPNYPWWVQFDWLLLGVFAAMSLLIMAGADLRSDALIVAVGLAGGLVIESWGTQTSLWTYYTSERPPLWIIPAWPIASLAIDRLYRLLGRLVRTRPELMWSDMYWMIFPAFYGLMLFFVWPTRARSLTLGALALCALLILSTRDKRGAVLTFAAGSGLGYFLEVWGTTRACWTYYTHATPPVFAVFAHGMAAVAFWRVAELARLFAGRLRVRAAPGAVPASRAEPAPKVLSSGEGQG